MPLLRTAGGLGADRGARASPDRLGGIIKQLKRRASPQPIQVEIENRSTGEAVLATAKAEGCDLRVGAALSLPAAGCGTVFGGATSHIMAHGELPVLMAH